MLAFEHSVERVVERLQRVYRIAASATPPKLVYLDMEEYRDLHLTVTAFRTALDQPEYRLLPGGIALQPAVSRAVQAARAGEAFDLRHILAGSVQGDVAGAARGLNFMGEPDTVVKQLKAFHDQCGVGVVDLFFQQPRVGHKEVMQEIELFGREVLPQIKEF